jgi:hypothetical protein
MLDIYSRNQSCNNGSKDMRFEYDSSPSTPTRDCGGEPRRVGKNEGFESWRTHSYGLLVIMTVELDSCVVSILRIIVRARMIG